MLKKLFFTCLLFLVTCHFSFAQYTKLLDFNTTNGLNPIGNLVISGNNLYGITYYGGADSLGCIFVFNTATQTYIDLYDFPEPTDGNVDVPQGYLVLSGSKIYFESNSSGIYESGYIMSIDTNGNAPTIIYTFNDTLGGQYPTTLILNGGVFYGTTQSWTPNGINFYSYGMVYSMDTNGNNFKILHEFDGMDGDVPGRLTVVGSNIYGMTGAGGSNNLGEIYTINTNGTGFKILMSFTGTNGYVGNGFLTYFKDRLYGMTIRGGSSEYGNIFSVKTDGSGFKNLLQFNDINGLRPFGSLSLSGNIFYGMTSFNTDPVNFGNIFSIDTNGIFNVLYNFANDTNGANPYRDVTIADNILYGVTEYGGLNNDGVIFSYNLAEAGIHQLVETQNIASVQWSVYPNPNNGKFTIQPSVVATQNFASLCWSVEVYNVLGEKVETECIPSLQTTFNIDLRSKSNGVYFYRVVKDDGSVIGEGKVVIQK